jgi:6-phosphofructokinase 1
MNAAVRAVARTAFFKGWDVMGIWSGYKGLLEGRIYPMDRRRLGGIIHRGGTVLGTERSAEFATPEGQRKAAGKLAEAGVEGLVVVGGNGSLTGGSRLAELGVEVVGVPATIDNDVWGTDTAIGVDTALNTALEAIDRIKDTASSHQRAHIVEVMGRDSGYLALMSAIAGGAEAAVVPEFEPSPKNLLLFIKKAFEQGKSHFVVAEGAPVSAEELDEYVNGAEGTYDSRLTVVGHIQRGGIPTASDRILASRLGRGRGPGRRGVWHDGRAQGAAGKACPPQGRGGQRTTPRPRPLPDGRDPGRVAGVSSRARGISTSEDN